MTDTGSPEPVSAEAGRSVGRRAAASGTMLQDPVTRWMFYGALMLVALFLATVVGVLLFGIDWTATPKTMLERDVVMARAAVVGGSTDAAAWGEYADALIANGQYATAREVIARGRASIDDSATADFSVAEARLMSAQGDWPAALKAAEAAIEQAGDYHQRRLAAGGTAARIAKADGLPETYYDALLLKAYAHRSLREWSKAIAAFDAFLKDNPTAADILIDRANVKIEAGDKAGAEKDFRRALTYIPDSAEAEAGLAKIGAAR